MANAFKDRAVLAAMVVMIIFVSASVGSTTRLGESQARLWGDGVIQSKSVVPSINVRRLGSHSHRSHSCHRHSECKHGWHLTKCCVGECVDCGSSNLHCGGCGKRCPFDFTCCKGKCVNFQNDRHNCGRCGKKCPHGVKCEFGLCAYGSSKHHHPHPQYGW